MIREAFADADDGYQVPLLYRARADDRAALGARVLVLPALGVEARFYRHLASALSAVGLDAAVMELRGNGRSALRPSRSVDFGWRELIEDDLPAAWSWLATQSDAPVGIMLGHSLGGHLAAIVAGLGDLEPDGLVLAATGTPWFGAYRGAMGVGARVLSRIVEPLGALLGHYPGNRVGFAGREARTVMADWAVLARTNRYSARGMSQNLDAGIPSYEGPVLSLRMADDAFAPEAAVEAVLGKFERAAISRRVLDAVDLGGPADHYGWARHPSRVAAEVAAWVETLPSAGDATRT